MLPPKTKTPQIADKPTFCDKRDALKKTFITTTQVLQPNISAQNQIEKPAKAETWDKEILELEKYFAGIDLPDHPVELDQCSTITNVSRFIESHLATVKEYNGVRTFEPCLNRLQTLKQQWLVEKSQQRPLKLNDILYSCGG